uniref:Phage tail protein n=1 Tax=Streptomyces sp. NBC_01393 TaxID=2903851 RepID=A0AAU3I7K3_9ACTN
MATTTNSIARLATDPLRNFKFQVQIQHPSLKTFARMGFMSVSGLNVTTEVIPYREGGMNTTTQKMPGQSDFAPITLSKGLVVGDSEMMDWMRQLFTVMQGEGSGEAGGDFRAMVDVYILDHPVTKGTTPAKAGFRIYNAWPTAVAFSDLDAGANAIVVQQMTLAHEGFEFKLAKGIGSGAVSFNSKK